MELQYKVDIASGGKTVKYILQHRLMLSQRLIKKLKYNNKIWLNGSPVRVNEAVSENDLITVDLEFDEETEGIDAEEMDLDIVYEDDSLIALNKEPYTVVHPTAGHRSGTLANGLKFYYNTKGLSKKIRPVNRLDKDTSGLIIFAKNEYVQEHLVKQMKYGKMVKEYLGVVFGNPAEDRFTIDKPIERKPGSIMERQISETGQRCITHVQVVERFKEASLLKFRLETGRTHQIRVHCQSAGIPLVGDTLYGTPETAVSKLNRIILRQALHSYNISFSHPTTGSTLCLTANLPEDINCLLEILRNNR